MYEQKFKRWQGNKPKGAPAFDRSAPPRAVVITGIASPPDMCVKALQALGFQAGLRLTKTRAVELVDWLCQHRGKSIIVSTSFPEQLGHHFFIKEDSSAAKPRTPAAFNPNGGWDYGIKEYPKRVKQAADVPGTARPGEPPNGGAGPGNQGPR